MTIGEAHEIMLRVRDTFPRLSREREALAVVSNALDAIDAMVLRTASLTNSLVATQRRYLDLMAEREATR